MRRTHSRPGKSSQDRTLPKYSIAVASDLSGVPMQQLRRMEESGLVTPRRTEGNTRRYSDEDLTRIAAVAELADEGINALGISQILELRGELATLRAEVAELRAALHNLRGELLRSSRPDLADAGLGRDAVQTEPR